MAAMLYVFVFTLLQLNRHEVRAAKCKAEVFFFLGDCFISPLVPHSFFLFSPEVWGWVEWDRMGNACDPSLSPEPSISKP